MSEEINTNFHFKSSPYDMGLDINNLPPAPWTPELIGEDLFFKLAIVSGAGDLRSVKRMSYSLDPRTFGRGRAGRIIQLTSAVGEVANALRIEGEALQAHIDASLPPPTGTPRHPGAPPLTPTKTVKKTRTF